MTRGFENNTSVRVEPLHTEQFRAAVAFRAARADQEWGLVDGASFQIMARVGISEALPNDHHLPQAGFTILMQ